MCITSQYSSTRILFVYAGITSKEIGVVIIDSKEMFLVLKKEDKDTLSSLFILWKQKPGKYIESLPDFVTINAFT